MSILFYSRLEKPYGCFSNFSHHGIEMDGKWWPTVEHYFQAQKFAGTTYAEKIRNASSPKQAADMGREHRYPLRHDWEQVKDNIMLQAVLRKFTTHEQLRDLLLSTGEEELIENSPGDYYWGCGADGSGKNKLGQILMQARAILRQANSASA
ncbi:NADAR family protein [Ktedonosporobacter rubrisoli]|uniref:NADAR family protein n=1 Tax=Ktedonosporobacter rubrisoli TaxID=2509675 RepID=A0A4P6JIE8_KTERU|nr:NADAR family protein [Ktedonosporobacter rubrisoli]QBD74828.1 NADAR family protein [Ktedonosporobacter rubrisoli]